MVSYTLRPYQQEAVDAVMEWVRKKTDPCLIEAATGSGKSMVVADIARQLHQISGGKRVLCLQPSSELTKQNFEKYQLTGEKASIYSASISKSLRHPVIYATPRSFDKVAEMMGSQFTAVIIDESHSLTPTIKGIIEDMKKSNPYLRVIGLTATPYRMNEGYIYEINEINRTEEETRNPYFKKLLYRITAHELISLGFLTPPLIGAINEESYDTSGLKLGKNGLFTASSLDKAFIGHGRKTSGIVADVVRQSQGRRGVMFFAATIKHAEEIMASLPPELSVIIHGNMPKAEIEENIRLFKNQERKYFVNVAMATTGFDAPHVDVIAILRKTESASLLQQIIGRGLRLYDGKKDVLVLDYANNIEDHFPDGDIFNPQIRATKETESFPMTALCELCGGENTFSRRQNTEQYENDEFGYYIDLDGIRIETDHGAMPAHHGRRCQNVNPRTLERCDYYWTTKECEECGEKNDITARRCVACNHELIDPNDKLIGEYRALKRSPHEWQCDEVLSAKFTERVSANGNNMIYAEFQTEPRKVGVFQIINSDKKWLQKKEELMREHTNNFTSAPKTITYRKQANGMWEIRAYNEPTDFETMGVDLNK